MELSNAEKAKARRDLRIIKVCVALGVVLPFALFFMLR